MIDTKRDFEACLDLPKPELYIAGDINRDMFSWVARALVHLRSKGSPEIDVVIDTPGGDTDAGLDIYDALRLYTGKKTAIVLDQAASMGAIILQACEVRKCAKHAGVLIHFVSRRSVSLGEISTQKGWKKILGNLREVQARLYIILEKATKKSRTAIIKECRKDKSMKAEEALEFGLVDEII
jgi:ATP-dependent Clp protease protease subunit